MRVKHPGRFVKYLRDINSIMRSLNAPIIMFQFNDGHLQVFEKYLRGAGPTVDSSQIFSTMHRLLLTHKTFSLLCHILSGRSNPNDNISKDNHETLVDLALTCKMLAEPVLNELWSTQKSLIPILKCLPEGVWELRPIDTSAQSENAAPIFLNRLPSRREWLRLLYYTRRVKWLHSNRYDSLAPSATLDMMSLAVSCYHPSQNIFPNVLEVHLKIGRDTSIHDIMPFLPAALQTICLTLTSSSMMLGALISGIHGLCPGLRELDVSVEDSCLPLGLSSYISLEFLTGLRRLKIGPVEPAVLSQIGRIQDLQDLEISIVGQGVPDFGPNAFQSLLYAKLTVSRMPHATSLLNAVSSHSLRRLEVQVLDGNTSSASDLRGLLAQMPKFCNSLGSLNITEAESGLNDDRPSLMHSSLHYLSSLYELRELTLHSNVFIPIDDDFLQTLSRSIPKLRRLSLDVPCHQMAIYSSRTSRITFTGLSSLARNCPNLQHLELDLNEIMNKSLNMVHSGPEVEDSDLHPGQIYVGYSPVKDPVQVAVLLSELFPNLQSVINASKAGIQDGWKLVQDMLTLSRYMGDRGRW